MNTCYHRDTSIPHTKLEIANYYQLAFGVLNNAVFPYNSYKALLYIIHCFMNLYEPFF